MDLDESVWTRFNALTGFFTLVIIALTLVVVFQALALAKNKNCKCPRRLNSSDMQLIAPDEVCPTMGWYFYKAADISTLDKHKGGHPCYQQGVRYSNDKVNWYFARNTGKQERNISYFYFVFHNYKGSNYPYIEMYNGDYYGENGHRQKYNNSNLKIDPETDYTFYIIDKPDIPGNSIRLSKDTVDVKPQGGVLNPDHKIEAISIQTASDGVDYQFSLLKVVYKFDGEQEVSFDL